MWTVPEAGKYCKIKIQLDHTARAKGAAFTFEKDNADQ